MCWSDQNPEGKVTENLGDTDKVTEHSAAQ
jgi:hypothetical protein